MVGKNYVVHGAETGEHPLCALKTMQRNRDGFSNQLQSLGFRFNGAITRPPQTILPRSAV